MAPEDQDAKSHLAPTPPPTLLKPSGPPVAAPPAVPDPPMPAAPGLSLVGIPSLPSQVAKMPAQPSKAGAERAERQAKIAKLLEEADLYTKFGLEEKAIDHLQQALALDPEHRRVLGTLKNLYIGVGDY